MVRSVGKSKEGSSKVKLGSATRVYYFFDPKVAKYVYEIRMAQAKLIYGVKKPKGVRQ